MPQMNGLQLREAVLRERPGLPVLIATGYGELPAGSDPAARRLAKPFTQAMLAAAVRKAVAKN
jgi:FixJ family two-component response regulator